MKMNENVQSDRIPEKPEPSPAAPESPAEKRNFFDKVADFFEKMFFGIIEFTGKSIVKLFKWIFSNWRAILRIIYSLGRAILWGMVWLLAIFAGWIAFALEKFLKFWRWVGDHLLDLLREFWAMISAHAGEIWFVIAIIGSVYGLLYVTLKRRAKRKNLPFNGVFSFLHRRKKKPAANEPVADGKK